MNSIRKGIKQWAMPALVTMTAVLLLRFVFFIGYVPSASMEPTIPSGSVIWGYRLYGELQRGDIIVFRHDGILMIKRIYGIPGDKIDLEEITYSVYEPKPVWEERVITVPKNCYIVLGDNSQNSYDSRYWEDPLVAENEIIARLFSLGGQ